MAARLDPRDAARLCSPAADAFARAMTKTTDPSALGALALGLSAVAAYLEPLDAARLCSPAADALSRAMATTSSPIGLKALSAVLIWVDPSELSRKGVAARALVASLADTAQPLTPLALFGPAQEQLLCPLSAQQLVDLLKRPTWVGTGRRLILDQLEARYRQRFADHWEFVRFAEEQGLGLDLTSPPQRPAGPPKAGGK
jgi:hypothetical protein